MSNPYQQGSAAWLELRKKYVTASEAPILMGVSPWRTAQQLFDEKMGVGEPQQENWAMRRGKDLEETARQRFESVTGIMMFPRVKISKDYPWLLASLDGIDIEEKHVLEVKCPGREDHELALQGKVPDKYYPQLQHQMIVCGLDKCHYFSYREDSTAHIVVDRDDEYCDSLIEKTRRFWDCMQTGVLTEEFRDVKPLYKEMDESWSYSVDAYKDYSEQIKKLEKLRDMFRDDIISKANGQNCQGYGIKVSKNTRQGSIDLLLIPELKDVNLDQYRKLPTSYWKLENVK